MKRLIILVLLLLLTLCGCSKSQDSEKEVDLSDPRNGNMITTPKDLKLFLEEGFVNECRLAKSIDMGVDMLTVTPDRGPITIDGNGFAITGSSDCVIRVFDGSALVLNNVEVKGAIDGVGIIGSATIGGTNTTVTGELHGINAGDGILFQSGASLEVTGLTGYGIYGKSITLDNGSSVTVKGAVSAICAGERDLIIKDNASLFAYAIGDGQYNAAKVAGTLILGANSVFEVENSYYHGAELGSIDVQESSIIRAKGGKIGVGLFLLSLKENYTLKGYCTPKERHEVGKGSLNFVE